jgi:hypothetical protein
MDTDGCRTITSSTDWPWISGPCWEWSGLIQSNLAFSDNSPRQAARHLLRSLNSSCADPCVMFLRCSIYNSTPSRVLRALTVRAKYPSAYNSPVQSFCFRVGNLRNSDLAVILLMILATSTMAYLVKGMTDLDARAYGDKGDAPLPLIPPR